MMSASLALQTAVYATLSGDAPLAATGAAVLDRPADAPPMPCVLFGPSTETDWSATGLSGARLTLALDVYSEQPGQAEAKTIAARIRSLLNGPDLPVDGFHVVSARCDILQVVPEDSGVTRAHLRMTALVQTL